MRLIRILLVDGHANVRTQIRARLAREPDFAIAGEAATSERAQELAHSVQPDVILMDPIMPDGHGLLALQQIAQSLPGAALVVLTAFSDTSLQMDLRRAGVREILHKGIASEHLVEIIRRHAANPSRGERNNEQ
jgi:DNA-binding NarL/FixJ family response regulator